MFIDLIKGELITSPLTFTVEPNTLTQAYAVSLQDLLCFNPMLEFVS